MPLELNTMTSDSNEIYRSLASAAEDIKVWESSEYSVQHHLKTNVETMFRSVHWSWDFSKIVSVPAYNYHLTVTNFTSHTPEHLDIPLRDEPSCAQFSNTSNSVFAFGNKKGEVFVWDIKQRKAFKTFATDNSETTCLQFNWNDGYIASGSSKGLITLHNVTMGRSNMPFGHTISYAVCDLNYSSHQKSMVGAAYFDGTVSMWDANTRQCNHKFPSAHSAPATGLKFAPRNPKLMVSVGLDRKICFFDVISKQIVKATESDIPINCFDFMEDGVTLALGGSRGKVLIHDIRFLTYPKHTIFAHNTSVNSLAFQNSYSGIAARDKMSKRNEISKAENSSKDNASIFSPNSLIFYKNDSNVSKKRGRMSLTYEVFSPLNEDSTQPVVSPIIEDAANSVSKKNSRKSFDVQKFMLNRRESLPVFSPLESSAECSALNYSGDASASPMLRDKSPQVLKVSTLETTYTVASNLNSTNVIEQIDGSRKSDHRKKIFSPGVHSTKWPTEKPENSVHCMPDMSCLTFRGMCASNVAKVNFDNIVSSANDLPDGGGGDSVTVKPPSFEGKGIINGDKCENEKSINGNVVEGLKLVQNGDELIDEGHGTGAFTTPVTPEAKIANFRQHDVDDAMDEFFDEMRKMFYTQHVQRCKEEERQHVERYNRDIHIVKTVAKMTQNASQQQQNFRKNYFL